MVDTSQTPHIELVDATTLLPIIPQHTLSGTTLSSDEWAAYHRIATLSGVGGHGGVNHSLHFIDPTTGVNSQMVENYRSSV